MNINRSHKHEIYTETVDKIALSAIDDKKYFNPKKYKLLLTAFRHEGMEPKGRQRSPGKDKRTWGTDEA